MTTRTTLPNGLQNPLRSSFPVSGDSPWKINTFEGS
eukprot:CAMPEP_0174298528 /NCGR_PEP_ID=MMETSP0809-20121228/54015_1 /TAXON_ID=73025 ORGANISM="Eutreptiella gymnastica-like, Strain CCMP1594" /NCGR_SAMPLE_ID=MMETSP0809 /ASSEMBLY_ACC=CAM_ASM_000658 /LENGTH=35 /DNA_ID= /DNA_START= /DNA_END= /DNA_ORIENTATION=